MKKVVPKDKTGVKNVVTVDKTGLGKGDTADKTEFPAPATAGRTCREWETLSLFETDAGECPLYNAVGELCGCPSNEPHPDSCGPLCAGPDDGQAAEPLSGWDYNVWGATCRNWDVYSTFLPSWYGNDDGEGCDAYYADVAYGCACPGTRERPMGECGGLCQRVRTCDPLCSDGSPVPDDSTSKVVGLNTCESWEYAARYQVHPVICPQFVMTGAMCGCVGNAPPKYPWSVVCGEFCGPSLEDVPHPGRVVYKKTCEEWHYTALYLPWNKCDFFEMIAHGCGCGRGGPPRSSCGPLCPDGAPLPDPSKVVGWQSCREWELRSSFDNRNPECGRRYGGISELCGCVTGSEYDMPRGCFEPGQLDGRTFFFFGNDNLKLQYSISFGPNGLFKQQALWTEYDVLDIVVGYSRGTTAVGAVSSPPPSSGTGGGGVDGQVLGEVVFSGGFPCGIQGTRTGVVRLVQTDGAVKPEIVSLIKQGGCHYVAVMNVPKLCKGDDDGSDGLTSARLPTEREV